MLLRQSLSAQHSSVSHCQATASMDSKGSGQLGTHVGAGVCACCMGQAVPAATTKQPAEQMLRLQQCQVFMCICMLCIQQYQGHPRSC